MAKKKKKEKKPLQFEIEKPNITDKSRISLVSDDTPLFCFKYFNYELLKKHDEHKTDLCFCFLERLQKLSGLGWNGIRISDRHQYGMEKIPTKNIKITNLPQIVTPDVKNLHVFRAKGNNLPFIGLQDNNVFHVFFIEPDFGVVYDH